MDRKMLRFAEFTQPKTVRGSDRKYWHTLELGIRGLNRWAVKSLEKSEKRGVHTAGNGMVQTQVTAQGRLGSTPEGRRPQIRSWRTGGSLAVSTPTPATPLLSPAKIRELNHAAFASPSCPSDRQVFASACRAARFPRVNEHTPAHPPPGLSDTRACFLTPNCQSRSARSRHT